MDGYCVFKEVSGAEIAVNARQVSYVRSTDGKTCAVYFSNNDHVVTAVSKKCLVGEFSKRSICIRISDFLR
jgi:hypothetical protein